MNYRRFVSIVFFVVLLGIVSAASMVVYIDPYFHYHKPNPEFYYNLKSQRYQNDGILKHFDYDAIITGTSMTENFKSSEFDSLYSVNSIKVSYSGGSFKEINDAINSFKNQNDKICPSCKTSNDEDAKYCKKCGTSLMDKYCEYCNSKLDSDATYCSNCGRRLEK